MRSKLIQKILDESPKETKDLISKYVDLLLIVNKVIREDCREEAMNILMASTDEIKDEFISYYNKDQYNICCMVIDKAKMNLPDITSECFGNPF